MSNSKMREEFETWVISNWPNQSLGRFNPLHGVTEGEYTGFTVQHCWDAWQASRQSLVIELPKPYAVIGDYAACGGGKAVWDIEYAAKITDRMCEKTDVYDRASLEAAGLKVKS